MMYNLIKRKARTFLSSPDKVRLLASRIIITPVRKLFLLCAGKFISTITSVNTSENIVALTFDDGPHPEFTPTLLELLEKYDVKATFFMVGEAATRHSEIVKLVAEAGHAICNHSWDHSLLPSLSRSECIEQIKKCQKAIAPYGYRIYRPPGGKLSIPSYFYVRLMGYQIVLWDSMGYDWVDWDGETIAQNLKQHVKAGSIVLMHDGLCSTIEERFVDRKPMFESLEIWFKKIGERYEFVTLPELLKRGQPNKIQHFLEW